MNMKQPILLIKTQTSKNWHPVAQRQDILSLPRGILYARWFVLSALLDICLCACWYIVPCPPGILNVFCNISAWGYTEQCLLIIGILVVFFLGSIIAFLLGYRFFEVQQNTQHPRRGFWGFLWALSDLEDLERLEKMHWPLVIGAALIFVESSYALLQNKMQPIPFALALIFLFLMLWVFCNKALRGRFERKGPLKHEEIRELSAKYLLRLPLFTRNTSDDLTTTIVGMQ